ncbi:uncharacterized protein LOC120249989 [Dioscorea cayenensis subsp. rotundata]|uniref:Uncharacterized protein LOC120249989 n=1 Tax=Dioscorea cayennensis subsp. rotundata TaxID=55577 RepID=A0AB40AK51_DIOCR|nr:uncharacterized protein LOC120249989 [Dioscorea cayenensis subsp. rotundata]
MASSFFKRLVSISDHLHYPNLSFFYYSSATPSSPPEPLLALLKSHNFSDSHISILLSKRPSLLRFNVPLVLAPKLRFLLSDAAAVPPDFLPNLIISNPSILTRSLDNHLKPIFHLIRSFIDSADDLLLILRRNWFLSCSLNRSVAPNIASLLSIGVPRDRIAKLITTSNRSLMLNPDVFRANIAAVRRAGIEPENPMFVYALRALNGMKKSTWDSRLKLFKEMGWSEELVYAAFRRAPLCVLVSDEKIRKSTEFFMKEVGFGPEELSVKPKLLMHAFEKRVLPRFKVFQVLEEKGLFRKVGKEKGKKVVANFFTCSEKVFLARYVSKYCKRAPELKDVGLRMVGSDGQIAGNC